MLAEELDLPISVKVAGLELKLGILDLQDLAEIQNELRHEAQAEAVAELPNMATPAQMEAARRNVGKLTIEGLSQAVFSLVGAPKFLRRQLIKGGSAANEDEADKLAARMGRVLGWRDASYFASDASGLFPPRDETTQENPDPNQGAGNPPPAT